MFNACSNFILCCVWWSILEIKTKKYQHLVGEIKGKTVEKDYLSIIGTTLKGYTGKKKTKKNWVQRMHPA
ncbi:MAG: hypothetical protein RR313_02380 [Anaerovoracaceae bacterium]